MANFPLYNGQNLDFTGNKNPYDLIQNAGKKRSRKTIRKTGKGKTGKSKRGKGKRGKSKTRKYRI